MSYKNTHKSAMSFAQYDVEKRDVPLKTSFFKQIKTLIDWTLIEKELKKIIRAGKKQRRQKLYNPIILFKMQLVSIW